DPRLATNNLRVGAREWLIPLLRERMASLAAADIAERFEQGGLPYAPIKAPHELLDDPHLTATGGLAKMSLPDEREVSVPLLPLMLDRQRLPVREAPPALGEDADELLQELGYSESDVQALREAQVLA